MMSSGFLSAAVMDNANTRLEQAIEDLRVKYEKKAIVDAAAAKETAAIERVAAAEAATASAKAEEARERDWAVDDPDLEALRQARMASLKSTAAKKSAGRAAGHGELREIVEDEFLKDVTSTQFVAVHFYHPEFETCKVMDKHLRIIAAREPQTKFLKINAQKAPFFVAKLRVKVLPSVVFFIDGVAVGRQLGFENLRQIVTGGGLSTASTSGSGSDARSTDFTTASLVSVLRASGVLGEAARARAAEGDDDDDDEFGSMHGAVIMADGGLSMPMTAEEKRKKLMAEVLDSELTAL